MGYVLKGVCSEEVGTRRGGTREVGEQEEERVREGEKRQATGIYTHWLAIVLFSIHSIK